MFAPVIAFVPTTSLTSPKLSSRALAAANNNLGAKFLFHPGSTEFWSDPKVSGPYPLWLRQIARQAAASKACAFYRNAGQ